ncbi:MAG: hypothetical protein RI955_152 [Bacteroidota bacterium]|jgi:hypothetical protein
MIISNTFFIVLNIKFVQLYFIITSAYYQIITLVLKPQTDGNDDQYVCTLFLPIHQH